MDGLLGIEDLYVWVTDGEPRWSEPPTKQDTARQLVYAIELDSFELFDGDVESAIRRDYPVMFATLYIFTLLGLVMQIIGDISYTLVDPRIDFSARR